jgi:orotidine-5'-phosphate decarboxylase
VTFHQRLGDAWLQSQSVLCVGLDPDPARLPRPLDGAHDALERFCREIVDATADLVCAFKPQIAYFASQRAEDQLERVCEHIRANHPRVVLILDAKRGDIGPTAEHYAREAFGRYGADAVTVNPYLGTDAVAPFLAHGGGVIALCRTSNAGGDELQSLVADGQPMYLHVARMVAERWSRLGDCGLVVGATYPAEIAAVRAVAGDLPLLIPGVGAQGGDAEAAVAAGRDRHGVGVIVNASRSVLYASPDDDFAVAARAEASRLRELLRPA